jgi:hypothetical protein
MSIDNSISGQLCRLINAGIFAVNITFAFASTAFSSEFLQ